MAILIHLRPREGWDAIKDERIFFEEILPSAPDVTVQLAHMSGWGGYDRSTDAGLSTLLDLCNKNAARCSHLYFDLAAVLLPKDAAQSKDEDLRDLAKEQDGFTEGPTHLAINLRRIPKGHVLFATDWPVTTPAEYLSLLHTQLLLKPAELNEILSNKAPYFDHILKAQKR